MVKTIMTKMKMKKIRMKKTMQSQKPTWDGREGGFHRELKFIVP
jgi:hypothetical protein